MRGIKKSRNGCATCKSKRLKCDESRPACGRCTRLRIKCPGYTQRFRWVTKHETFEAPSTPTAPKDTPGQTSPSTSRDGEINGGDVSPSVPNSNAESPEMSTFEGSGTASLNNWDQDLDIEHLDHQFSTTLPELEHLNTPAATRSTIDLDGFNNFPLASNIERRRSTLPNEYNQLMRSNSLPSTRPPPSSLFRRQFPIDLQSASQFSILPLPRKTLEDPSSTLVEYYFKEVAGLFSSYDSHMNPFRTTVSRLWASSPAMCRTLQSMAAATLVDDFPQFGPVGLKMRKEAILLLESQETHDDKSLLAMLMLGQTASWHNPNDLGISYFNTLRNHLNSLTSGINSGSLLTNRNNYQFFEEALIYWEMLLSFVADTSTLNSSAKVHLAAANDQPLTQKVPHPWTGIARDTQFIVNKVGRLVRRERKRIRAKRFTSQRDITQAQEAIREALELEERLLSLAHPAETDVVNPGDNDTPVWHLLAMAEVYRHTGLLQLYRVFPDLLRDRLQAESILKGDMSSTLDPSLLYPPADVSNSPNFAFDIFGNLESLQKDDVVGESNGDDVLSEDVKSEWLTTIALTAMSRLKTVPLESRTRCLQPFLLVASSSELRLPAMELPSLDPSRGDYSLNLSAHAIEVSRTRKFILGRLTSFLHVLPPKPIRICVDLVQEVWQRMDAGESDVYWMDVMIDKGWETTMG
ncbi:hypothetical protein TMatcc_001684 [Talaromyces marneffei ATCC 18224]|uniref:Zn(2)-C6 fungal-type domain-containing protein n=1 Tax=Talaromyces marneffei (strain ATCC 18224 / CBS 334.59 / QM 7333) TaxID=441960 RepID=B6QHI2_TALMQ|nr:uncharacterized protein EYB26_007111 [Talaromyces marneffei]EEA22827.1 conserved hypothetical protein [Talaromyces marneffei ATCC 18224]KAE8551706.1 hypothetical protein EYB25_005596 [Talaromyces marneffei]QGA19422.1 hypothetical protein EYB26_007111 [Talaromyces marneffei]